MIAFMGAIILGFIAQLFISHQRYEFEELKHVSTKSLKKLEEFDTYSQVQDKWGQKLYFCEF